MLTSLWEDRLCRSRMSYFFLYQLILKACRACQSGVHVNNNISKRTAGASHQYSNSCLRVRSCSALLFLGCSSNFPFSATNYWVKDTVFGLRFLQLWKIQNLKTKVIVAMVVFGRESEVWSFLQRVSWCMVLFHSQWSLEIGQKACKTSALCCWYMLSWVSKFSMNYFKCCLILDVIVK